MKPFAQLAFDSLPDTPHKKHAFAQSEGHSATMNTEAFGRHTVHWRVFGQGPPLLLVHGLMTHSYSWRYAFQTLGQQFTCYAPDLVGCGQSEPVARPYPPQAIASWIGDFQSLVDIEGCPAIGNSMGGYLCMLHALEKPTAFSALVNLHGPGLCTPRIVLLHMAMSIPGAHRLLDRLIAANPEKWAFRNVHYYDESLKSMEEARAYAEPLRSTAGRMAFARYLHQTMAPQPMRHFEHRLKTQRFPIPLQLLYAEQDPMVPPVIGHRYAKLIAGAETHWLQQASHFAHVDAVDSFAAAVLPFLLQHK